MGFPRHDATTLRGAHGDDHAGRRNASRLRALERCDYHTSQDQVRPAKKKTRRDASYTARPSYIM